MRRVGGILAACAVFALPACGSDGDTEESAGTSTSSGGEETSGGQTTSSQPSATSEASGASASAATDSYPDAKGACTSLAPSQVEQVLGSAGEAKGSGDKCYVTAGEKKITVYITTLDGAGYDSLDDYVSTKSSSGINEKVPGIGDAAFFTKPGSELTFVVGEQFITVDVELDADSKSYDPNIDKSEEKKGATALATTIADRAPIKVD